MSLAQRRKIEREKMKQLKVLMYSLVQSKNAEGLTPAEQLRLARDYVFVTTDLQSSTAQAAASPTAFLKIQEIHDTVLARPWILLSLLSFCLPAHT